MLPWAFTEEAAAEKHMAQLQHNMWVIAARAAVLSVITGGGKWVEIKIHADPLYQHLLLTAEKKFWRSVQSGEPPRLFGVEPLHAALQGTTTRVASGLSAPLFATFAPGDSNHLFVLEQGGNINVHFKSPCRASVRAR